MLLIIGLNLLNNEALLSDNSFNFLAKCPQYIEMQ